MEIDLMKSGSSYHRRAPVLIWALPRRAFPHRAMGDPPRLLLPPWRARGGRSNASFFFLILHRGGDQIRSQSMEQQTPAIEMWMWMWMGMWPRPGASEGGEECPQTQTGHGLSRGRSPHAHAPMRRGPVSSRPAFFDGSDGLTLPVRSTPNLPQESAWESPLMIDTTTRVDLPREA